MYQVNDDMSIYVTRGDIVNLVVTAEDNGEKYIFQSGDVVRIKVFAKKDCEIVVLQKDYPVVTATETVEIFLDKSDTKFGEVISKPRDYWYEIELNPETNPRTIIGYDEDGPRVFKLFPEGRDLTENDPVITPEDIPIVDDGLDLSSARPVENRVATRALYRLEGAITSIGKYSDDIADKSSRIENELKIERARIDNIASLPEGSTSGDAELQDIRLGADGTLYSTAGVSVREQIGRISESEELFRNNGFCRLKGTFKNGSIAFGGTEYDYSNRVMSKNIIQYARKISITVAEGFKCSLHFYSTLGAYDSESGWVKDTYNIPANISFKVVIARMSEDTTETADITEFVNALKITTALSEVIEDSKKTRNALDSHFASNKHLETKVLSDNIFNAEESTDGGYYAWNTGAWTVRSDISTTGLIPCEKGQKICWGVTTVSARGGNVTFWTDGGDYVTGFDTTDGSVGLIVPDDDRIKYFRISFYKNEKSNFRINLDELKEYDEYACAYSFDKEIVTPLFNSSKSQKPNIHHYTNTYKDDVCVLHNRNIVVGTSYKVTIINKTKFDGTATKLKISGTSNTNALGDSNNRNVSNFAKANDYLHIINGGIYLVASGEADGITIINGNILKETGVEQFSAEQYVLGINKYGEMKCYINETAENILSDGSIYALTGFVPLIQDGVAVSDVVLSVCPHYNVRHPRQIVGVLSDGNYFTFCCDGRTENENGMTLAECISTITDILDVRFAFNLDGGGSTQTTVGKKQINRVIDGRKIPNVIVFE